MPRPRLALLLALAALAPALPADATSPFNLTVLSHTPIDPGDGLLDGLFVHDELVFLMESWSDGTTSERWMRIYDASDLANPRLLSRTRLANRPADMHGIVYSNRIVYAGVQRTGGGVHVFDVSDPANPRALGTADPLVPAIVLPNGAHNLRLAGDYLYVASNAADDPDLLVFDVSDPANPAQVNEWSRDLADPTASYCHDVSVVEDVAYASLWDDGLYLLDVSDPGARPLPVLGSHPTGANTHSAWPTPDLTAVVTCHEATGEDLRVWDLTARPVAQLAAWRSAESSATTVVHDAMVVGNFAYVSHYGDGLRILDLSDRTGPVEVASYLTGPGCPPPASVFCDGIAQWVENGVVFYLDMGNGLWIFAFELPHDAPIRLHAVKSGPLRGDVELAWNHTGESQFTVRGRAVKDSLDAAWRKDVDGRARWSHRGGVAAAPARVFYTINGPWRGRP